MDDRKTITEYPLISRYYSDGELNDTSLVNAVEVLTAILNDIPAEYREQARFTVDNGNDYDLAEATITVSYTRPETDEEVARRHERQATEKRYREAEERRRYEVLKAKFG